MGSHVHVPLLPFHPQAWGMDRGGASELYRTLLGLLLWRETARTRREHMLLCHCNVVSLGHTP